jgi:hypothetical protein
MQIVEIRAADKPQLPLPTVPPEAAIGFDPLRYRECWLTTRHRVTPTLARLLAETAFVTVGRRA